MRHVMEHKKWMAAAAVTTAVVVWTALVAVPAKAQAPVFRIFRIGPASVAAGQTLQIDYSNILGKQPVQFRVAFLSATNGALIGAVKNATVAAGAGDSGTYTNSAGGAASVIAIIFLAEPRPDPFLTAQLVASGGGGAVWLAEPRPDPILNPQVLGL